MKLLFVILLLVKSACLITTTEIHYSFSQIPMHNKGKKKKKDMPTVLCQSIKFTAVGAL